MKILIGAWDLGSFWNGIATWTLTMLKAFRKLGHEVHVFAHFPKINPVFGGLPVKLDKEYDLILCNTGDVLKDLKKIKGKKVFIAHGVIPPPEQPVKGADAYIAVSEEVADNFRKKGFHADAIMRQPIDFDKFHHSECSESLKTVGFLMSWNKTFFIEEMEEAGLEVKVISPKMISTIEEGIAEVDLLIGSGRPVYEAMSMGKNVIVVGMNNGKRLAPIMDGFVDSSTFYEYWKKNMSGRCNEIPLRSFRDLEKELKKYTQEQGYKNRRFIFRNNNYMEIARRFISLAWKM